MFSNKLSQVYFSMISTEMVLYIDREAFPFTGNYVQRCLALSQCVCVCVKSFSPIPLVKTYLKADRSASSELAASMVKKCQTGIEFAFNTSTTMWCL